MEGTYKKSKGNAGQKGVNFQLDLITLCLLNALRNHKNWKISSENPMAGKYDDIVIELDLETTVLIQAKHKENKKITKDQLLSDNSKNSDFSLAKYFLSYEEIKNKFQSKTVIICTNTAINTRGLEDVLTCQQAQPDSLLRYEGDCSFYNVNEKILPDLKMSAEAYLRNNSRDNDVDTTMITEENLKDFLEDLQIFTCYPCEDYLHEIIEQSLSHLSCFSPGLCPNISSQDILKKVEDWFLQPKGEYLTEAKAKSMVCEIRSDKYCESLKDFNVSFGSNDLNIAESQRIVHVKITEGYLLQILKVYYALQVHKSKKLYVNPDDAVELQKLVVEAFGLRRYKSLIMVWDVIKDEAATREITNKVRTILERNKYKQVILVADIGAELAQQFGLENISQIDGSLTLQDLSKDSQERLLKTQNVLFQGHRLNLDELLYTQEAEAHTKSLVDSAMLERVVRGKEIKVGVRPLDLDEDTARYYVSRRFESRIEETGDTRNILSEENLCGLKEKMIVISDSAGMGKSTVLTKMAVTIKKTNPSLWVMKINLSDYTRVLRDFVKSHKTQITAAELLNSQEATRMTNKFENLVFSMHQKVVIMLDGADEISPDYTDLVISLLSHCQEAPNFAKIFVTTRPHVDLTQKEVGLFQLLPFSELEQKDFLINYWMHNLSLSHEQKDRCNQYAEMLIRKVTSWTKSNEYQQHSFADIPLQARMLAEIFQENIKGKESVDWEGCKEYLKRDGAEVKLPERFNMAKLYDTFIEKKRDIFIEKGSPDGNAMATPALLNQFESCLAYHRTLAVTTILPEYKELFKTQLPKDNDTKEYILKIGIVQRLGERVHFIHRTFAEYFLADSIVQELKLKNPNAFFQRLLIDQIFGNDEFNIVRVFLDVLLQTVSPPTNSFKEYRSMKYEKSNVDVIFKLAHDGHVEILQLILKSVGFKVIEGRIVNVNDWRVKLSFWKRNTLNDIAVLVRLAGVNIKREDGVSLLHLAVKGGHLDMVDFLVKRGAGVNVRGNESITALHIATYIGNLSIVKYLVQHGADVNAEDDDYATPLHGAAKHNRMEIVEFLLENGANIDMTNSLNDTALHLASYNANWSIVKYLVEHGANLNAVDDEGLTAMHMTVAFNETDIAQYLLEHGADINIKTDKKGTALHMATYHRNWDIFEFLMQQGADVNERDGEGFTALHVAAKHNLVEIADYLLEHGTDINIKSSENHTPLQFASCNGNWDIVKYLVEHDADINAVNDTSATALHDATNKENWEMVDYLIEHGADVTVGDDGGFTALHIAVKFNETDKVKYLLEHGINVNIKNFKDKTALHIAAYNENWDMVKYLIEHNATNINAKDDEGLTALHITVASNEIDIIVYLLEHGADINAKNKKNTTALHIAVYERKWAIVKYLVEHSADINAKNDKGVTALHMAAKFGKADIVEFLLKHGADVNIEDNNNCSALEYATYRSYFDIVDCLVMCGAKDCSSLP